MEFFNEKGFLKILTDSKNIIDFEYCSWNVKIDNLDVNFPWEYEKSSILLEVKEYDKRLFYSFTIDWINVVIISDDSFELKEEILSFFGDIDVLIILWTKQSAKIFENIEARIVIPYWSTKEIFLNTLWQNVMEVKSYKLKWELPDDNTEFVNLEE